MLRPYQIKALEEIRALYRSGIKRVLLHMSAGAGKTVVFCEVLKSALALGNPAIMVVRGRKLVDQASRRLFRENIDHGVFMAGHWNVKPSALIQVCSVDTLYSKKIAPKAAMVIVDECFKGDVEILTNRGFKRFDELDKTELIAQVDGQTLETDFVAPTRFIENDVVDQNMISFFSDKKINLTMTENHDFFYYEKLKNIYGKSKARELILGTKQMVSAVRSSFPENKLSCMEKLMIMYQADGNNHSVGKMYFQFSKQRKIDAFLKLMADGDYSFAEISGKKANGNSAAKRRFSVTYHGIKHKKINEFFNLNELSFSKCREIIEYMVKWDGSIIKNDLYYFSSTIKVNTDFYSAVACLAGYSSRITIQEDHRKPTFNKMYRLYIRKSKITETFQAIQKIQSKFTGKVFCVSVPKENIIVRTKDRPPIVMGNCHLTGGAAYDWLFEQYPGAYYLPVSATPYTRDGLKKMATKVVKPISMLELVRQGFLVAPKYYAPSVPDLRGVKTAKGDYENKELEKIMNDSTITGDIVRHWLILGKDKPTLLFAVSVVHSKSLVEAFIEVGVPAIHIDANASDAERQAAINRLETGEIKIISSVGILTTGVDIPCVETIILARPTKSYSLHVQIIGRGTRPFLNKNYFTVLDHAGNLLRHGCVMEEREATLEPMPKGKTPEISLINCQFCFVIFPAASKFCPECGEPNAAYEEKIRKLKESVEDLIEMDPLAAKIIARIAALKDISKRRNYKRGWVFHVLKEEFGESMANYYLRG